MAGSLTFPTALSLLQSYPALTRGTAADARRLVGFQHHFSSNYDVTMLFKNRDFRRLEPASRHSGYQTKLHLTRPRFTVRFLQINDTSFVLPLSSTRPVQR